jgi:hypothetical protein
VQVAKHILGNFPDGMLGHTRKNRVAQLIQAESPRTCNAIA